MTDLPQSFYKDDVRRTESARSHIWLAALLALVSGWTLFGLPGNPVHLLRLPEDVPSFGVGLGDVYFTGDGTLSIQRFFYADRMGRYEYDPDGGLHKYRGVLRATETPPKGMDWADVQMPEGHTLKIRPSRAYYKERAEYRKQRAKGKLPEQQLPSQTPEMLAIDKTAASTKIKEPYAIVLVYGFNDTHAFFVLPGHTFYEVLDDYLFHHPDVWITTDRLKYLSHIRATDVGGKIEIKELKTVPLDLGVTTEYDCALRLDKRQGELMLLLPTGQRYWFDPVSLKQLRHEKLEGTWEREYASLGLTAATRDYPGYPVGTGWALTERGYQRLMRALALTFIASLIWLGLELLKQWRSTSGRTTAATS